MDGLVLREASPADADILTWLVQSAFEEYRGRLEPPSGAHQDTAEALGNKLATASAVIAEADGQPVGCVFYQHFPTHTYLGRLAVLPEQRGNGIGTALIDSVEAQAREAGRERVPLGTRLVLTENRAYYARRGYREAELGTHPGCTEPTFIWMEKPL